MAQRRQTLFAWPSKDAVGYLRKVGKSQASKLIVAAKVEKLLSDVIDCSFNSQP